MQLQSKLKRQRVHHYVFPLCLFHIFLRETWNVKAWDALVQPTGKYSSIHHMEYPKFHSGIFGRTESILRHKMNLLSFTNYGDNILDPRALVFYHVTDGDKSSGELYARVARIWLQGSHSACSCFQKPL